MTEWYDVDLPYEHGSAKIVCDSVNIYGDRLTTVEAIIWRPALSELNTHRMFSRNSASSRAIPLRRANRRGTLDLIEDHPASPMHWGAEKPGMQSGESLTGIELERAKEEWDKARKNAIRTAERLSVDCSLHKSLTNRLLEPFMWHRVILSATQWENFFNQRSYHRTSEAFPEFAILATKIEDLMKQSHPKILQSTEWHLPYILPDEQNLHIDEQKAISVGRCARVSYLNHDLVKSVEDDVAFCKKLVEGNPMHSSPFEHVATPSFLDNRNFRGWRQYRYDVERERKVDSLL